MKLTRVIILKMSGDDVCWMQKKLKEYGFHKEKIDGYFGQNTLISVTNFQRKIGIQADGVVGPITWSRIINYDPNYKEVSISIKLDDISNNISYIGDDGLRIYDNILSDDEYYKKETQKNTIWLHHTAGGSRPDWTIGGWEKDYKKDKNGNPELDNKGNKIPLRIGTPYVIGRRSSTTNETLWDGKVLKAFDDRYYAYHLGIVGINRPTNDLLNSRSIGVEICNYGPLVQGKDSRFYNYVNKPINDNDVVELQNEFRGYKYWERYTDAQLESTRKLILYLEKKWNIELERGVYNEDWFNYDERWFSLGGLRSHTQVRKDKFDLFPQKELIQMLNSI